MNSNIPLGRLTWILVVLFTLGGLPLSGQEPLPSIVLLGPALDEPYFVEVDRAARRADSFVTDWLRLKGVFASSGITVEKQWVSPSRLYLRVQLPRATVGERNVLLALLQQQAGVARVISAASANSELKDLHAVEGFEGGAMVPEAKLRGFRSKMEGFNSDTRATHTGEILVKYLESESNTKARTEATRAGLALIHASWSARVAQTMDLPDGTVLEVVEMPKVISFEAALQAYNDSPLVEYAQPNYVYTLDATPNDPGYGFLWAMPKIDAPAAWNVRNNANSIVVAVTDTGIDYNHADLVANMWINPNPVAGYDGMHGRNCSNPSLRHDPMDDYAPSYHGTHVAGTIGAMGNNGTGVVGISWAVKLMAVKVFSSGGSSTSAVLVDGIDYSWQKSAHIINASWGGGPYDQAIRDSIARARNAGVMFINSAGNFASDNDAVPHYPSRYNLSNMLVVGASDRDDQRSLWPQYGAGVESHWGRWSVDAFAPGSDIYSTQSGNAYGYLDGTSMAAPHVSGMLALSKAHFPSESMVELIDRARFSVDSVGALNSLSLSGGRINAAKNLGSRPRLQNLSTRAQVNTGTQIAIAGVIIAGTGPKEVVFRAQGPNLGNHGVPGVLANPEITVYNSAGQVIGYNDDWVTLSTNDKYVLSSGGLTPAYSAESAWVGTLAPGAYTVHLSGVGGETGIGIIESFDVDGSTVSRLHNVSTRCYVGTGYGVTIAGTIVAGDKPRNVYIRALGPTLTSFGVPGALQDTVITLYQGTNPIASNDDWGGGGTAFGNRLVQNGNPPVDSRESALIARLEAGHYTVFLEGKGGSTGVGLIEINEY
jgi:subtilisin family serine protease